jgi:hypothetical protein
MQMKLKDGMSSQPRTVRAKDGLPDGPNFRKDAKVSECMSWPVNTLSEEADLITRDDELTGILTHEDLLRSLAGILRVPTTLKDRVLSIAYNSPLREVSKLLSLAGV